MDLLTYSLIYLLTGTFTMRAELDTAALEVC